MQSKADFFSFISQLNSQKEGKFSLKIASVFFCSLNVLNRRKIAPIAQSMQVPVSDNGWHQSMARQPIPLSALPGEDD
jgi:hypothetical protein